MQEVIEQIIDYLKGIWIKRRYIMIATWLICPIGWYMVSQLDDVYESNARVYVDTQSMLDPLLRGLTVTTNTDMQVKHIVRTLLSRPNLEKIARKSDLDIQANTPEQYNKLLDSLKGKIKINSAGRENIYTISFRHKNRDLATQVVSSSLDVFIENTLGENRNDTSEAQKFLDAQIREYQERLDAAETRLTEFRQKYSDVLPNQSGGYYQQLSQAKANLKSIELELKETETRLASAKAQLSAPVSSSDPQAIRGQNSIETTYDTRIAEMETTLDSLQLRYTDRHPDVIEVKSRLEQLNKLRQQEINAYLAAQAESSGGIQLSSNPVMQEVQIQINQLENQVASLNVRAEEHRSRVRDLEEKIHVLPEIEQELKALNRGYNVTKSKHEELLNSRETASLAQDVEESTSKIQFRVIDPPRAGDKPTGPKRILLFLGITFAGFGVGIGLSLLFSQINPVVTSSAQLSKATGIPVFGAVSATESLGLQKWNRKKTLLFVLSNTFLLVVLAVFIAYFLFPSVAQPIQRIF